MLSMVIIGVVIWCRGFFVVVFVFVFFFMFVLGWEFWELLFMDGLFFFWNRIFVKVWKCLKFDVGEVCLMEMVGYDNFGILGSNFGILGS